MNTRTRIGIAIAGIAVAVLGISATSTGAPAAKLTTQDGVRPATAQRTALAVDPQTTPETHFVAIAPCRILDTRKAGGALATGKSRAFYVSGTTGFAGQGGTSGGCRIPTGATAVTASLAVVKAASKAGGYVKAYPYGAAVPGGTALNYNNGSGVYSSGVTIPIRTGGGLSLTVANAGATVSIITDVSGYYIPAIQALIGGSGAIDAGTSRVVSVSHAGTGFYYVTLDRPARQCSPSAVTYNYGHYASVGLSSSSTPNVISVLTWNVNTSGGAVLADESFFLTVTC